MIVFAGTHHLGDLIQGAGDGVQPRKVVLIVLGGVERHGLRQVRQGGVEAVLLIDRHLVGLQAVVLVRLLQAPFQQLMAEPILFAHAIGGDALQAGKKLIVLRMFPRHPRQGLIRKTIVIPVVPHRGRHLGVVLERGLPVVLKERILRAHTGRHVTGRRRSWQALSRNNKAAQQKSGHKTEGAHVPEGTRARNGAELGGST